MNEQEWMASTNPTEMLEFLRGKVSDRKLRLLACANCRLLWGWVTDQRSRQAVVVAERLSDGLASDEERSDAFAKSFEAATLDEYDDPEEEAVYLRSMAAAYAHNAVWDEAFVAAHANSPSVLPEITGLAETLPLHLLRDIFGNPFRLVALDPSWLTSDVVALATGVYAGCAFDRMPILGDALQDAGCDDPDILNHCRGPGPHARGCHVLDLILGKS